MKAKGKTCPAGKGPIFGCLPRAWLMRRKDLGSDMVFFEVQGKQREQGKRGKQGKQGKRGKLDI